MDSKTINLHYTDFCNFHCKHCFIKKNGKELSLENIKLIADKLAKYQQDNNVHLRINIAGGEPLLSNNIQTIIDYFNLVGIEVSIITNGYYLTKEFIRNNRNKLSMIGISVDSLNEETNIKIGRCCNNVTLSNNKLISLCNEIKNNGIKLKINTCVTSLNVNEDIKELLDIVKPDRVKVLRALCENELSIYNISDDEWEEAKKKYPNSFAEDNDYMKSSYIIIDSEGNLTKNNLHLTNNSILEKEVSECFENLKRLEEQSCQ